MDLLFYFFIFIFGTFIGSFLGVIIYRLPRNESIIRGRSHCDHCKKSLTPFDLIPVFSFLFLKGRCRYCKTKLSWFYPLVEIVTGTLFVLAALYVGSITVELFYYFFIISSLIVLFFIDLKHGILPFSVIVSATVVAFVYLLLNTPYMILNNLLAGLGAFLFFLLLFLGTRGRGMGFGDVIFVFFMGLFLGFPNIVVGLYIAFISGAVVSLILVALKLKKLKGGIIPFGPFLVLGTLCALFWGKVFFNFIMVYLTN